MAALTTLFTALDAIQARLPSADLCYDKPSMVYAREGVASAISGLEEEIGEDAEMLAELDAALEAVVDSGDYPGFPVQRLPPHLHYPSWEWCFPGWDRTPHHFNKHTKRDMIIAMIDDFETGAIPTY